MTTPAANNTGEHPGLVVTPLTNQSVGVYLPEATLIKCPSGDTGQVGVRLSTATRLTGIGTVNPGITCSLATTGANGLDTGTVQPNTDYWLSAISDGISNYQFNWSTVYQGLNAYPSWCDAGSVFINTFYWARTDANGHIPPISKMDKICTYVKGSAPLVMSGLSGGFKLYPLNGLVDPASGGTQTFRLDGGDPGKQILVGADASDFVGGIIGQGYSEWMQVDVCGWAGGVYILCDDPYGSVRLTSFISMI